MTRPSLYPLPFALAFFLSVSIQGKEVKGPLPGIGKLTLDAPKAKAKASATADSLFKGCEMVFDSNVFYLSAPKEGAIRYEGVEIASLKCMFNKKRSIQGMNVIFPARTVDGVEKAFAFAEKMLGPATTRSGEKIGFLFEAEWKLEECSASFFANNTDFEAILLLGLPGFVKEEEERGKRFGN